MHDRSIVRGLSAVCLSCLSVCLSVCLSGELIQFFKISIFWLGIDAVVVLKVSVNQLVEWCVYGFFFISVEKRLKSYITAIKCRLPDRHAFFPRLLTDRDTEISNSNNTLQF